MNLSDQQFKLYGLCLWSMVHVLSIFEISCKKQYLESAATSQIIRKCITTKDRGFRDLELFESGHVRSYFVIRENSENPLSSVCANANRFT